jgi:shikimate dehydrogenase
MEVTNPEALKIDRQTFMFGLLADKASISTKRALFKQYFDNNNINASYIPMNIREDDIYFTVNGMKESQISAVNIDPEYSKIVFDLMDDMDEESRFCGVFNSIEIKDKKLYAYTNISNAIYQTIEHKKIGIIGLGSLAKSLIFNARSFNIKQIVFYHNSVEDIASFIKEHKHYLRDISIDIERIAENLMPNTRLIDVLINATPIGQFEHEKPFLLQKDNNIVLLDTFIKDKKQKTFFEIEAKRLGLTYIGGKTIELKQVEYDINKWIKV